MVQVRVGLSTDRWCSTRASGAELRPYSTSAALVRDDANRGCRIRRATFGGPSHGQGITALDLAAQNNHVEMVPCYWLTEEIPHIEDAIYHSSPVGCAYQ